MFAAEGTLISLDEVVKIFVVPKAQAAGWVQDFNV